MELSAGPVSTSARRLCSTASRRILATISASTVEVNGLLALVSENLNRVLTQGFKSLF